MKTSYGQSMIKYTSFRAGGQARRFCVPENAAELAELLNQLTAAGEPYLLLGNGTNTLFTDGVYEGTVIQIGEAFGEIRLTERTESGGRLLCGAGALLSRAAKEAARSGLTGMEFAAGIPGSIGGAVFMNAGAYGGEMKDILDRVLLLMPPDAENPRWHEETVPASVLDLSYRHSALQESGAIVLQAEFCLPSGDPEEINARMAELAKKRSEKQPLEYPSAGSFFKRPPGYFAGKLIEDAGLAGLTVGGAQVSAKHCGFVINRGGATGTDILELMHLVQNTVYDRFGVHLEPEVRIIGTKAPEAGE